jgi:hypothetical protein
MIVFLLVISDHLFRGMAIYHNIEPIEGAGYVIAGVIDPSEVE